MGERPQPQKTLFFSFLSKQTKEGSRLLLFPNRNRLHRHEKFDHRAEGFSNKVSKETQKEFVSKINRLFRFKELRDTERWFS